MEVGGKMIKVSGLTKMYGDRAAIDTLNFSIKKGELVGFLGPNGAGKTTTMRILTGFMAPSKGSVEIDGHDIFADPIQAKQKIGYLPETPPVYMDMKVTPYLRYVATLRGVHKDELTLKVEKAIERLDLKDVSNRLIQNLSKGFRQRVGLAQAIVSDPEVLILDEPTVGLDPTQVAHFRELLKELKGNHTIILSTHILPEVQASCERLVIINNGKIVAEDSLSALSAKASKGKVRVTVKVKRAKEQFVGSISDINGVVAASFAGEELHLDCDGLDQTLEAVSSRIVESGMGLLEMKVSGEQLEDIFLELTKK